MDIDVVDGEYQLATLKDLLHVALLCLSENSKQRPGMADCVQLLHGRGLVQAWELWHQAVDDVSVERHDLLNAMEDFQSKPSVTSVFDGASSLSFIGRSVKGGPR
eukprot:TRINITY_DN14165_c0_g1_i1.p1 TRINITY_DN14165_c0_g1~~TRINITY_DN14165_c0_g1_i1.p1  ORF type:complete len:122 (+),score=27.48 TRINITY_DN14165_c0_g1_i1:53-367(+)